ncbi:MAG: type II secretion system protein J [bacterium]
MDYNVIHRNENGFTLLELLISISILAMILAIIMGAMRLGSKAWDSGERRIEKYQRVRVVYDLISEDIRSMVGMEIRGRRLRTITKSICPGGKGCNQKAPLFIGEPSRITFVSANPGLEHSLSRYRYRVVTYYLAGESPFDDEEVAAENGIVMREEPWLFDDFFKPLCSPCDSEEAPEHDHYTHVLYPNVRECSFEYFGKRNLDEEESWDDTWNPLEKICECDRGSIEKELPVKIRVTFVSATDNETEDEEARQEISFEVPLMVPITDSPVKSVISTDQREGEGEGEGEGQGEDAQ